MAELDPLQSYQTNAGNNNLAADDTVYNPSSVGLRDQSARDGSLNPNVQDLEPIKPTTGVVDNAFAFLMDSERKKRLEAAAANINPALKNKIEILNAATPEEQNDILSGTKTGEGKWNPAMGVDATYNRGQYQVLKINGELVKGSDLQSPAALQNLANKQGNIILDPATAGDAQKLQDAKDASNYYNLLLAKENEANGKAEERFNLGENSASYKELEKLRQVDKDNNPYDVQTSLGIFNDNNESTVIKQYAIEKGDKNFVIDYKTKLISDKTRQANVADQDKFQVDLLNAKANTPLSSNWKTANDWANIFLTNDRGNIAVPASQLENSRLGVYDDRLYEYTVNNLLSPLTSTLGTEIGNNIDIIGSLFTGKTNFSDAKAAIDKNIDKVKDVFTMPNGQEEDYTSIKRNVVQSYITGAWADNNLTTAAKSTFNAGSILVNSIGLDVRTVVAVPVILAGDLITQVVGSPLKNTVALSKGEMPKGLNTNISGKDLLDFAIDGNIDPVLKSGSKDLVGSYSALNVPAAGLGVVLNAVSGENKKENLSFEDNTIRGITGLSSLYADIVAMETGLGVFEKAGQLIGIGSKAIGLTSGLGKLGGLAESVVGSVTPRAIKGAVSSIAENSFGVGVKKVTGVIGESALQGIKAAPVLAQTTTNYKGNTYESAGDQYAKSTIINAVSLGTAKVLTTAATQILGTVLAPIGGFLNKGNQANIAAANSTMPTISSQIQSELIKEVTQITEQKAFQKAQNISTVLDYVKNQGINVGGMKVRLGDRAMQSGGFAADQLIQTAAFATVRTLDKYNELAAQGDRKDKSFTDNLGEAAFGKGGAFTLPELAKDFATNLAFGLGTKAYKGNHPEVYKQQLYDAIAKQPLIASVDIKIDGKNPTDTLTKIFDSIKENLPESSYVKKDESYIAAAYENGKYVNVNSKLRTNREVGFDTVSQMIASGVKLDQVEDLKISVFRPDFKDGVDYLNHNYQTANLMTRFSAIENQAHIFKFDIIYKEPIEVTTANGSTPAPQSSPRTFAKSQSMQFVVMAENGRYRTVLLDSAMGHSIEEQMDALKNGTVNANAKIQTLFNDQSGFVQAFEKDNSTTKNVEQSGFGVNEQGLVYKKEIVKSDGQKIDQWVTPEGVVTKDPVKYINKNTWVDQYFNIDMVHIKASGAAGNFEPRINKLIDTNPFEALKQIYKEVEAGNSIDIKASPAVLQFAIENKVRLDATTSILGSRILSEKFQAIQKLNISETAKKRQLKDLGISSEQIEEIKLATEKALSSDPDVGYKYLLKDSLQPSSPKISVYQEITNALGKVYIDTKYLVPDKTTGYISALEKTLRFYTTEITAKKAGPDDGTNIGSLEKIKLNIEKLIDNKEFLANNQLVKDFLNDKPKPALNTSKAEQAQLIKDVYEKAALAQISDISLHNEYQNIYDSANLSSSEKQAKYKNIGIDNSQQAKIKEASKQLIKQDKRIAYTLLKSNASIETNLKSIDVDLNQVVPSPELGYGQAFNDKITEIQSSNLNNGDKQIRVDKINKILDSKDFREANHEIIASLNGVSSFNRNKTDLSVGASNSISPEIISQQRAFDNNILETAKVEIKNSNKFEEYKNIYFDKDLSGGKKAELWEKAGVSKNTQKQIAKQVEDNGFNNKDLNYKYSEQGEAISEMLAKIGIDEQYLVVDKTGYKNSLEQLKTNLQTDRASLSPEKDGKVDEQVAAIDKLLNDKTFTEPNDVIIRGKNGDIGLSAKDLQKEVKFDSLSPEMQAKQKIINNEFVKATQDIVKSIPITNEVETIVESSFLDQKQRDKKLRESSLKTKQILEINQKVAEILSTKAQVAYQFLPDIEPIYKELKNVGIKGEFFAPSKKEGFIYLIDQKLQDVGDQLASYNPKDAINHGTLLDTQTALTALKNNEIFNKYNDNIIASLNGKKGTLVNPAEVAKNEQAKKDAKATEKQAEVQKKIEANLLDSVLKSTEVKLEPKKTLWERYQDFLDTLSDEEYYKKVENIVEQLGVKGENIDDSRLHMAIIPRELFIDAYKERTIPVIGKAIKVAAIVNKSQKKFVEGDNVFEVTNNYKEKQISNNKHYIYGEIKSEDLLLRIKSSLSNTKKYIYKTNNDNISNIASKNIEPTAQEVSSRKSASKKTEKKMSVKDSIEKNVNLSQEIPIVNETVSVPSNNKAKEEITTVDISELVVDKPTELKTEQELILSKFDPEYLKYLKKDSALSEYIDQLIPSELEALLKFNDNYSDRLIGIDSITSTIKKISPELIARLDNSEETSSPIDERDAYFDPNYYNNAPEDKSVRRLAIDTLQNLSTKQDFKYTEQALTKLLAKVLPESTDVGFAKMLITPEGQDILGQFSSSANKITLLSKDGKGQLDTAGHEAFHAIFDTFDAKQREDITKAAVSQLIGTKKTVKEKTIVINSEAKAEEYLRKRHGYVDKPDTTFDKLKEEELAENFGQYFKARNENVKPANMISKVKDFFVKLYDQITVGLGFGDKVRLLYNEILEGKYVNTKQSDKKLEISNKTAQVANELKFSEFLMALDDVIEANKDAKDPQLIDKKAEFYQEKELKLHEATRLAAQFGIKTIASIERGTKSQNPFAGIPTLNILTAKGTISFHMPQMKISAKNGKAYLVTDYNGQEITTTFKYDETWNKQRADNQIFGSQVRIKTEQADRAKTDKNLNDYRILELQKALVKSGYKADNVYGDVNQSETDVSYRKAKSTPEEDFAAAKNSTRGKLQTKFENDDKSREERMTFVSKVLSDVAGKNIGEVLSTAGDGKIKQPDGVERAFTEQEWKDLISLKDKSFNTAKIIAKNQVQDLSTKTDFQKSPKYKAPEGIQKELINRSFIGAKHELEDFLQDQKFMVKDEQGNLSQPDIFKLEAQIYKDLQGVAKIGDGYARLFAPTGLAAQASNSFLQSKIYRDFQGEKGWGAKILGANDKGEMIILPRDQLVVPSEQANMTLAEVELKYGKYTGANNPRAKDFVDIEVIIKSDKKEVFESIKDKLDSYIKNKTPEGKAKLEALIGGKKTIIKEKLATHAYNQMVEFYNNKTSSAQKATLQKAKPYEGKLSYAALDLNVIKGVRQSRDSLHTKTRDRKITEQEESNNTRTTLGNQKESINDYFYTKDNKEISVKDVNLLNPVEAFVKDLNKVESLYGVQATHKFYKSLVDSAGNSPVIPIDAYDGNPELQRAVIENFGGKFDKKPVYQMNIADTQYYVADKLAEFIINKDTIKQLDAVSDLYKNNLFFNAFEKFAGTLVRNIYSGIGGAVKNIRQEIPAFAYKTTANSFISILDNSLNTLRGKTYGKNGEFSPSNKLLISRLGIKNLDQFIDLPIEQLINVENDHFLVKAAYNLTTKGIAIAESIKKVMPTDVARLSAFIESMQMRTVTQEIKNSLRRQGIDIEKATEAQVGDLVSFYMRNNLAPNFENSPRNAKELKRVVSQTILPASILGAALGLSAPALVPLGFATIAFSKSTMLLRNNIRNKNYGPVEKRIRMEEGFKELLGIGLMGIVLSNMVAANLGKEDEANKALAGTQRELPNRIKTIFGTLTSNVNLEDFANAMKIGDISGKEFWKSKGLDTASLKNINSNYLEMAPNNGLGAALFISDTLSQLYSSLANPKANMNRTPAKGIASLLYESTVPKATDQLASILSTMVDPKVMQGNGKNVLADIKPDVAKLIDFVFAKITNGSDKGPFESALVQKEIKTKVADVMGKYREVIKPATKSTMEVIAQKFFGEQIVDVEAVEENIKATNQQLSNTKAKNQLALDSGKITQAEFDKKTKSLEKQAQEAGTTVDKIEAQLAPGGGSGGGSSRGGGTKIKDFDTKASSDRQNKINATFAKATGRIQKLNDEATKSMRKVKKAKAPKAIKASSTKSSSKSSFKSSSKTAFKPAKIVTVKYKSSSVKAPTIKLSMPKAIRPPKFTVKSTAIKAPAFKFKSAPIKNYIAKPTTNKK